MERKTFTFAKLYPRAGAKPLENGTVLVDDGVIQDLFICGGGDLPGERFAGVALPGFIDSHVHLTATGLDMLAMDAQKFSALPDLLEAIFQVDREQEGLVRVWGYEPDNFREQRYPTLEELDKACPNNLLWINHIESHGTIVNSRSLAALNLPAKQSLLVGEENQWARHCFLAGISPGERREAISVAAGLAATRGVTTLHAMEGGRLFHNMDVQAVLAMQDRMPVDTVIYPQVTDVDWTKDLGLKQIGGCLPLDGSSGVYTAALTQPYHGQGGRGSLYYSRQEIADFVRNAQEQGLQVAMHACGDAAIDIFLDAVEQAGKQGGIPHRIEHFEIPRPDQVERCAALGLILSMQPAFDWFWGGSEGDYARTLGPRAWQNTNPLGWAVRAGLVVAGGSDSGVTPLDPLLGIQAAVSHHNPEQRVSMDQAVAIFTENGAQAARLRDRGRLEPGLRADIVVLDGDPWSASAPKDIQVLATIKGGQVVYKKTAVGG